MKTTNLDIYGHAPLEWSRAERALEAAEGEDVTYWLATVRPGRPAARRRRRGPVGRRAALLRQRARDAQEQEPRRAADCSVSVRLKGLDLVLEGTASRVTDQPALERLAARYAAQGWPASVEGDAFTAPYSAPSAGPPPWNLYVLTLRTAFGVAGEDPHGATRWDVTA